jgi:putative membrane protein
MAADTATACVAFLHFWFLLLEMYFWDKPLGLRVFGLSADFARASRALAANQGLYNGFLAAGLIWGLMLGSPGKQVKVFFLCCVVIAGLFGGVTANKSILLVQALPGAIALALVFAS